MLERNHTVRHPRSSHLLRLDLSNTRYRSWRRRLMGNTSRRFKISPNLEDSDLTGGVMLFLPFDVTSFLPELSLLSSYSCYHLSLLSWTIFTIIMTPLSFDTYALPSFSQKFFLICYDIVFSSFHIGFCILFKSNYFECSKASFDLNKIRINISSLLVSKRFGLICKQ